MEYGLRFGRRALKDLQKIDSPDQARIVERIRLMASDLAGDVKRLTEHSPEYRLRVGDFRVLFDIEDDEIIIQRIRNRREAY